MRKAGMYLRVSTDKQTVKAQERDLRQAAREHGWRITKAYKEEGVSGNLGRNKRPQYDRLLKDVENGKLDTVIVWSIDRISRDFDELIYFFNALKAHDCDIYSEKEAIDTRSRVGMMNYRIASAYSENERLTQSERMQANKNLVRAEGRSAGGRQIPKAKHDLILTLTDQGLGPVETARIVGCDRTTVWRVNKRAA